MLTQRGRSRLLRVAALLLGLAGSWTSCAAPPPPAAEHALAAPPAAARVAKAEERRCGAVRQAKRTWVGFAEGMTLDDMVPAGHAAEMVVRAIDSAVCALSRGDSVAALAAHRLELRALAAEGGKLEVTKVLWQDAAASHARLELQSILARPSGWTASVVRRGETWKLETFATAE